MRSGPEARPTARSRVVFRHRAMTTGFAVGTGLILLLMPLAWSQPTVGNIVGTAVMAIGLWFIWAAGWWTKVRVSEGGVFIDNVFFEHVIPWEAFDDFSVNNGLVARLSDGTTVRATSFGGSLAGAITQYRGMSKKRDAMMAACRKYRTTGKSAFGQHRQLIRPHLVALLMYVVPLVGIAIGIDAARHVL